MYQDFHTVKRKILIVNTCKLIQTLQVVYWMIVISLYFSVENKLPHLSSTEIHVLENLNVSLKVTHAKGFSASFEARFQHEQ